MFTTNNNIAKGKIGQIILIWMVCKKSKKSF